MRLERHQNDVKKKTGWCRVACGGDLGHVGVCVCVTVAVAAVGAYDPDGAELNLACMRSRSLPRVRRDA